MYSLEVRSITTSDDVDEVEEKDSVSLSKMLHFEVSILDSRDVAGRIVYIWHDLDMIQDNNDPAPNPLQGY